MNITHPFNLSMIGAPDGRGVMFRLAVVVAVLAGLWGPVPAWGDKGPGAGATSSAPGTLSGRVVFEGPAPKRKRINMGADPNCARHSAKQKVLDDSTLVAEDGAIQNVLVYVTGGLADQKHTPPSAPVNIEQVGCMYSPRVFAVMTGQAVVIRNGDPTLHNVHGFPKVNSGFNFAQPVQGMENKVTFDKPESFIIKCDVHPWMITHCRVFAHPYFAVTGDNGRFEITGLPAGQYTLEAWHERLGTQTLNVTVGDAKQSEPRFTFKAKSKGKPKGKGGKDTKP